MLLTAMRRMAYMSRTMSRRFRQYLIFVLTVLAPLASSAEPLTVAPQEGVLLLRNGHALTGKISSAGDRYYVVTPTGELTVKAQDVELQCADLEEGYQRKRAVLDPRSADAHLQLAEWCLRHEMFGPAARELSEAMRLDPAHPKIAVVEQRIDFARREPRTTSQVETHSAPSSESLERMVRGMPSGAVAMFTHTIQPLLLNTCATGECHGSGGNSQFSLLRIGNNRLPSRRLTLRNLSNTMDWVDLDHPEQSRLLSEMLEPHGGRGVPIFTSADSPQYQQLVEWVRLVASQPVRPQPSTVAQNPATLMQFAPVHPPHVAPPGIDVLPPEEERPQVEVEPFEEQFVPDEPLNSQPQESGAASPAGRRPLKLEPHSRGEAADPFDPEIFNRRYFPRR